MRVAMTFVNSPKKSIRRAAQEISLQRMSLGRLMPKLNLKPYRPRLLRGLLEDDPDRRLQFCEIMRNQISDERDRLDKIIWSDEACFKLSSHVNRHNCRIISSTNFNAQFSLFINNMFVTLLSSTCFEH